MLKNTSAIGFVFGMACSQRWREYSGRCLYCLAFLHFPIISIHNATAIVYF